MNPRLSFVVRTFNSERTLPSLLARICGEDVEVVCVDSGSTDGTLEVIAEYGARLITIPPGRFSYGNALNIGFAAARSDWIVAISSHCMPASEDYVARFIGLVSNLDSRIVAVAGEVVRARAWTCTGDDIIVATSLDSAVFRRHYNGNPNCAYRRWAWQRLPFDEEAPYGEDELWVQAALKWGYVAVSFAVPVLYRSPASLLDMFKKGWRDGRHSASADTRWRFTVVRNSGVSFLQIIKVAVQKIGRLASLAWHSKSTLQK